LFAIETAAEYFPRQYFYQFVSEIISWRLTKCFFLSCHYIFKKLMLWLHLPIEQIY